MTSTQAVKELRERAKILGRKRKEYLITDYEHEQLRLRLKQLRATPAPWMNDK